MDFHVFLRFAARKVVSLAMENGPFTVDLASKMVIFHSYVRVVSGKLKIEILAWGPGGLTMAPGCNLTFALGYEIYPQIAWGKIPKLDDHSFPIPLAIWGIFGVSPFQTQPQMSI